MAQISYRANLSSAIYPMTLARAGRSVIIPGPDQNYDRRLDPQGEQKTAGIPQAIYMENVLPTSDGYQSVGYSMGASYDLVGGYASTELVISLQSQSFKQIVLQFHTTKVNWAAYTYSWAEAELVGTPPGLASVEALSSATVNGVSYLFNGTDLYKVDINGSGNVRITNITATVLPAGILTGVTNICSAFNYMILLKGNTLYHSSTISPLDFQASLVTGAGSSAPNNTAGLLKYLRASPSGYYLYCSGNVIAVTYTGNARFPWKFTPVLNSEGVGTSRHITGNAASSVQYAITSSGTIQAITGNEAVLIGAELGELLTRMVYRDVFDTNTNTFSVQDLNLRVTPMFRLSLIGNKFLILSKGLYSDSFDEAYVYDLGSKRYGKLNVVHTSIVDVEGSAFTYDLPQRAILCIDQRTGTSKFISTDIHDLTATFSSVLVLGKFQYSRSRFICLDEVEFESGRYTSIVGPSNLNFSAYVLPTLNGKTFLPAVNLTPKAGATSGDVLSYYSSAEGQNIALLIKGAFDLSSVGLKFHLGGSV